jgi:hypothetical protein
MVPITEIPKEPIFKAILNMAKLAMPLAKKAIEVKLVKITNEAFDNLSGG